VVHGASSVTGIDLHIAPAHVSSKEPLQLGAGGAREAAGSDRPRGRGDLQHNGTHWRSLLIQRKDRVPNRNVRTIRRLCAASLVGSTLEGGRRLMQNLAASTGQLADGCDPSEPNWAGCPLYRRCDNLAMLHDGLAKLMRMSMRNMW
jgi:hypothetical protein